MRKLLADKLKQHFDAGLWREHKPRTPNLINFNSNDYLGLATDATILESFNKHAREYGLGSGSANTLSGYTQAHENLKQALCEWLGRDDALLFSSGYQANLTALTTLIEKDQMVFADKLNHASLVDGMRFSGANFQRYAHLNYQQLDKKLSACEHAQKWVITESLYSMDGDEADLNNIASIAQNHEALLYVDEAHSLGLSNQYGIEQAKAPLMMATFGKSLGGQGAFIAGDKTFIDAIMQFGRSYLFTTALSPAMAGAMIQAIECVKQADDKRTHLNALIRYFRERAQDMNLQLGQSSSPIQPILFKDIDLVNHLSEGLFQNGILVASIRYPTVAMDAPRLRITLTANHSLNDIDKLFDVLKGLHAKETSDTSCV